MPTQPVTASYRTTAQSTRNRRQAAGRYAKPTQEQELAFKALVSVGEKYINQEGLLLLSTHPYLTVSQRSHYAALAAE